MSALALYEAGLSGSQRDLRVRTRSGAVRPVPLARYLGDPSPADETVLGRARGPVLDVGCGPARLTVALARRGVSALGVDIAPGAVALARHRGAAVIERSVFAELPGTGHWRCALLLDGNVGIGGDPVRLIRRVAELLGGGGELLVELAAPGAGSGPEVLRLEPGRPSRRAASGWFPWATVAVDDVPALARSGGLTLRERWSADGRWFARLAA